MGVYPHTSRFQSPQFQRNLRLSHIPSVQVQRPNVFRRKMTLCQLRFHMVIQRRSHELFERFKGPDTRTIHSWSPTSEARPTFKFAKFRRNINKFERCSNQMAHLHLPLYHMCKTHSGLRQVPLQLLLRFPLDLMSTSSIQYHLRALTCSSPEGECGLVSYLRGSS